MVHATSGLQHPDKFVSYHTAKLQSREYENPALSWSLHRRKFLVVYSEFNLQANKIVNQFAHGMDRKRAISYQTRGEIAMANAAEISLPQFERRQPDWKPTSQA